MTLLVISFLAGALTVLAPCILPLLPVVLGTSVGSRSRLTPIIVISSLALSIFVFTFFLKVSTALITIPQSVWAYISGGILVVFGLIFTFPQAWESLSIMRRASVAANSTLGAGHQKQSLWGDAVVGAALGPVFSTCSPTYFVILATVLPASLWLGTVYLLAYIFGLILVLGLIALLGQSLINRLQVVASGHSVFKRSLGVLFVLIGLIVFSGLDKDFEAWLLEQNIFDSTRIERSLLDRLETTDINESTSNADTSALPKHLVQGFPNTSWQNYHPRLETALSGGPGKDGIPALDDPAFISVNDFPHDDQVPAIALLGESEVKVYPYNILIWHEIVNDTIDDRPVAVTFCPLCGSAIVYDRTLPDGTISTFGVSGSLLESNMIMYDRATESLWQQSTGQTLAGEFIGQALSLAPMQLSTVGTLKKQFPNALVLSEDTGHQRNYERNPYVGYDEQQDAFYFVPSNIDFTLPPKDIVIVAELSGTKVALAYKPLLQAPTTSVTYNERTYLITNKDSLLTITDDSGTTYPFYFEMWFSYAVQHGDTAILLTP